MPFPRAACVVSAVAVLAAGAFGCTTPGGGVRGWPIHVSGDYVHPATGAHFPERFGTLTRSSVTKWDAAEANVGVNYDEAGQARISVFLYPAGDARAGRLRGEFLETSGYLEEVHPAAMHEASAIVRSPRPDGRAVGFEARFKLLDAEGGQHTLAQVFQCGHWFLKVRATHGEKYPIDAALDGIHDRVRCRDLAARDPIGREPGIDLDPAVSGSNAEWIAHGVAELAWIQKYVAPEDLAYGIPDHEPALYVHAWEVSLQLREELQQKGEAAANPFLDRMLEVRNAGFLTEYVWSEYLGFLPPPDEMTSRLDAFRRWRETTLPGLRHEVHAAAHLHD